MTEKQVDVTAVVDSANYFRMPLAITLAMIVIMLTDGFDLFTMGYVGPHLLRDWNLARPELGPVNSAGLIGMAVGSVVLGWLGDRIGRKRAYVTCLAFLFVGSLLCYFASSIRELTAWRLVTGIGLGGVTPLAATLISEWTPKRVRSVVLACVVVAIPLGGTLAGVVARNVIPEYGWRSMFLIGAIAPLVLFAIMGWLLPESPQYLAQHRREWPRLVRALNRLVGEKRFDGSETFTVPSQGRRSANWFATLWNEDYRRTTALLWVLFVFNTFVLYVYTNYLPTLLDFAGRSAEVASRSLEMFSFGGAFGSVGGAFLIGYFGSRPVGTALATLGGIATLIIGALLAAGPQSDAAQILFLCLVAGAAANGMHAFIYAVGANAYPPEVRASAIGLAQTFSRIGGVASASAAPIYFAMQPTPPIDRFFWFVAACVLVVVLSFALIPKQIAGRDVPPR
jgi:AAHS family 4-hydroxybenzoate transporter-like MFS transporter